MLRDLVPFAEEHQYEAQRGLLAQGNRIASTRAPRGLLLEPRQVLCEPHVKERNPNRSIESRCPGVSHDLLHSSPREVVGSAPTNLVAAVPLAYWTFVWGSAPRVCGRKGVAAGGRGAAGGLLRALRCTRGPPGFRRLTSAC